MISYTFEKGDSIQLLEDMKSCVTQGQQIIPANTVMRFYFQQLSWKYFMDAAGNVLIIMGYDSSDWNRVKRIG